MERKTGMQEGRAQGRAAQRRANPRLRLALLMGGSLLLSGCNTPPGGGNGIDPATVSAELISGTPSPIRVMQGHSAEVPMGAGAELLTYKGTVNGLSGRASAGSNGTTLTVEAADNVVPGMYKLVGTGSVTRHGTSVKVSIPMNVEVLVGTVTSEAQLQAALPQGVSVQSGTVAKVTISPQVADLFSKVGAKFSDPQGGLSASIDGTTLYVNATNTAEGNYQMDVIGTSTKGGDEAIRAKLPVTVTKAQALTLKVQPSLTIEQGKSISVPLEIGYNGDKSQLNYFASSPAGLRTTFADGAVTFNAVDIAAGQYVATIQVSDASSKASADIKVTVVKPGNAGFTVSTNPASLVLFGGETGNLVVSATPGLGLPAVTTTTSGVVKDAGGSPAKGFNLSISGQNVSISVDKYTQAGDYVVQLSVTSNQGATVVKDVPVIVSNSGSIPPAGAPAGWQGGQATDSASERSEKVVFTSPNSAEVAMMNAVNEVRRSGTINGQDAVTGTCAAPSTISGGGFARRSQLDYSGVLSFADTKHATYMIKVANEGTSETKTTDPLFYGENPYKRAQRSSMDNRKASYGDFKIYQLTAVNMLSGVDQVRSWMRSYDTCMSLMQDRAKVIGAAVSTPNGSGSTAKVLDLR